MSEYFKQKEARASFTANGELASHKREPSDQQYQAPLSVGQRKAGYHCTAQAEGSGRSLTSSGTQGGLTSENQNHTDPARLPKRELGSATGVLRWQYPAKCQQEQKSKNHSLHHLYCDVMLLEKMT